MAPFKALVFLAVICFTAHGAAASTKRLPTLVGVARRGLDETDAEEGTVDTVQGDPGEPIITGLYCDIYDPSVIASCAAPKGTAACCDADESQPENSITCLLNTVDIDFSAEAGGFICQGTNNRAGCCKYPPEGVDACTGVVDSTSTCQADSFGACVGDQALAVFASESTRSCTASGFDDNDAFHCCPFAASSTSSSGGDAADDTDSSGSEDAADDTDSSGSEDAADDTDYSGSEDAADDTDPSGSDDTDD